MTPTSERERNERIARRFTETVVTDDNVESIEELCTEDVVEHSPLGERRGREELVAQSEYVHAAFPDVDLTVEATVAEGDLVAQRLTFRGTHEGEFVGVDPTGIEVEIQNTLFTRLENGQIAERWLLVDTLGLLQQLGAVDLPSVEA